MRHPNPCRFGRRCQFKKKNECLYLHDTLASHNDKSEALSQKFNKQFEKLEGHIKDIKKDIIEKDSEIKLLKGKLDDFEKVDNGDQINNLKKDLKAQNAKINGLEIRLEEVEKGHQSQRKQQEKRIKELENICKQKTRKEKYSETQIPEEQQIKCNKCDYTTTSRQGLKIHCTKVHSKIDLGEFPAACNICEKILDSESKLKKHKKSEHTYHSVRYQCNECEFMANEISTLQVHFGTNHSVKKQCGLCDRDFGDLKTIGYPSYSM